MSEQSNDCGPGRDPEFFRALTSIFLEHPDAASRYAIARANHLIDPRGGDGSRTGVLKDVEGGLSLEFVAKPEQPDPGSSHCYLWEFDSETGTMRCAISYEKI